MLPFPSYSSELHGQGDVRTGRAKLGPPAGIKQPGQPRTNDRRSIESIDRGRLMTFAISLFASNLWPGSFLSDLAFNVRRANRGRTG